MEQIKYNSHSGEFIADKMKPCPFCGGEAELKFSGNDYTKSRTATAKCKSCRVQITNGAIKNNSEWCGKVTIEDWNKRI